MLSASYRSEIRQVVAWNGAVKLRSHDITTGGFSEPSILPGLFFPVFLSNFSRPEEETNIILR
jgi:hypothetical protein